MKLMTPDMKYANCHHIKCNGFSEFIYFYVADNIRIVEIEYVLKYLLAFNYVISRSEELQEYNHG